MASRCRSARWGEYLRRWGFSPRHPQRWAYEQQPQAIKKWRHEHYPAIKARAHAEGAEIQWGDETGIGSEDHRGRGYGPKGKTPVARTSARRVSTSMISTVTNRGKLRFMVYQGALNVDLFIKFLRRLIKDCTRKIFLFVDSLKGHVARKVTRWVQDHRDRIELFYLPAYCPKSNPDEYLNNAVKTTLREFSSAHL